MQLFQSKQAQKKALSTLLILFASSAFLQTEAVPNQKPYLLPEYLNLPFNSNDLPPEMAAEIKAGKVDLRKLAVTLIERKRQFQNRWRDPDAEGDVPSDTFPESCDEIEILSFFPEQYIDGLIEKGQLNMHQTGISRGLTQRELRAKAENSMLGIRTEPVIDPDPKALLHYLRPKYGLVNFQKPCGIRVNPNRLLPYGQVIIVYNDDVKLRTTYTYGDSLANYCYYLSGDRKVFIEPRSILEFSPPEQKESKDIRYVETQTWGPIDLTDIKEFRIPKERTDLLDKLKKANKPIYAYSRDNIENSDYHMDESEIGISRGEQLFPLPTKAAESGAH